MRHLAARMHACVSATSHGQDRRLSERQGPPERLLDASLDGGEARLSGPAMKG
jgi:hypothetical protein